MVKNKCCVHSYGYCRGDCSTCVPSDVAEVVLLVAEEDPIALRQCLRDLGYEKCLSLSQAEDRIEPFHCSVLQTRVVVPCQLHSCPYWMERADSSNCLLHFSRTRGSGEDLQMKDISDALDISLSEVVQLQESGLAKLRHMSIGIPVGVKDLRESFEFLPNKEVCCVCERRIADENKGKDVLEIPSLGLAYCSLSCRIRKSPTVISLENKFHVDIAEILEWALANFTDVDAMSHSLGMSSYAIQQLIVQFMGSEALKQFPGEIIPEASSSPNALFAFDKLNI